MSTDPLAEDVDALLRPCRTVGGLAAHDAQVRADERQKVEAEVRELRAERDEAQMERADALRERDSVQFALDGQRHVAQKDNEYLIQRAEKAESELARIRALLTDDSTVATAAEAVTDAHWCESNYTKGCNCGDYRRREASAVLDVLAGLIGGEGE